MKEKIWNLFKLTGDIKYYLMYKEMESLGDYEQDKSERNNY